MGTKFGIVLLLCSSAAGLHAADLLVLGAANTSGQSTRLAITNRAPTAASIKIGLVPGNPASPADPVSITIPPMATAVYENALVDLWTLADARGVLTVGSVQPLLVTAGKYTISENGGRAGSPLPVGFTTDLLPSGSVGDLLWITQSADPASGISANIELYLASAGTAVEIALFNADGAQVASRKISGGPATQLIPVASLLDTGLTVARAEVRVTAGLATAALELVDNATGQRTTAAILREGAQSQSFTLPSAFHSTTLNQTQLRTDARLFNPGTRPARVTAQFQGTTYTVDIAAKGLIEVADVLAVWFGAGDPVQGLVQITSTLPVIALERTTAVAAADSTVAYDDIHLALQAQPLLTDGSVGVIGGLRAANAQLMLSVRGGTASDVTADLVLRDVSGQLAGRASLAVDKAQVRLVDLGELFAGVSIPEDGVLEVTSLTGELDVAILSVDQVTGDADYLSAQPAPTEDVCPPPQISFVNTSARNLAQAGDVTFTWSTRQADSVALMPVAPSVPADSSFTTRVTASATFTLVAKNACGTTQAPIAVSVGAPVLRGVSVLGAQTGSGGQPGQAFMLNLGNVGDTSGLTNLILRQGTQIEMTLPIAGYSEDGLPYAFVPLLADTDAAARYRTGAFTLTAVISGRETAPIPFNIVALPAVADPVASFRTLLDNIAAASRTSADGLRAAGIPAAAVQSGLATAALLEADLRKMLADITASGRATLTHGLRLTSNASTPSVIVTRNDLAAIVAANANYLAAGTPFETASAGKGASAGVRSAGTCLEDKDPYIKYCKGLEDTLDKLWLIRDPAPQVFNDPDLDAAFQRGRDSAVTYINNKLRDSVVHGVLRKVNIWVNYVSIVCALQPIWLQKFDLSRKTFPIGYPRGIAVGQEIRAILMPKYNQKKISDAIIDEETQKLMDQVPQKYNDLKPLLQPTVRSFVEGLNGDVANDIAALIRLLPGLREFANTQVGKCDINQFYALTNGLPQDKFDEKKAILIPAFPPGDTWGRDTYVFQGKRKDKETMCIRPYPSHFLYSQDYVNQSQQNSVSGKNPCAGDTPVGPIRVQSVGRADAGPVFDLIPKRVLVHYSEVDVGGSSSLSVTLTDLNAWCVCEDQDRSGIILPGTQISSTRPITDSDSVFESFPWRASTASVSVQKAAKNKWRIRLDTNAVRNGTRNQNFHDALAKVRVSFFNPPNRYNTQNIIISVRESGPCERPASFSGVVSSDFGSSPFVQQPSNPFRPYRQIFVGGATGSMMLSLGGELTGFNSVTTTCSVEADIELLDGPPVGQ